MLHTVTIFVEHVLMAHFTMMAKPMKTLESHLSNDPVFNKSVYPDL